MAKLKNTNQGVARRLQKVEKRLEKLGGAFDSNAGVLQMVTAMVNLLMKKAGINEQEANESILEQTLTAAANSSGSTPAIKKHVADLQEFLRGVSAQQGTGVPSGESGSRGQSNSISGNQESGASNPTPDNGSPQAPAGAGIPKARAEETTESSQKESSKLGPDSENREAGMPGSGPVSAP